MTASPTLALLADLVLVLHLALVLFVIVGVPLVVIGNARGWRWVNALAFRLAHLATIGVVVAESWLGILCPLTTLEQWLRAQAHHTAYRENFVEHWVQRLLFYQAPDWVFTLVYTVFGALVVATWLRWPPRRAPIEAPSARGVR